MRELGGGAWGNWGCPPHPTPGLPQFLQTNLMVLTGSNYTSQYLGMTLATDPTNGNLLVRMLCSVMSESVKLNARKLIEKKDENK